MKDVLNESNALYWVLRSPDWSGLACADCGGHRTCGRCGGSGGGPELPLRCGACNGTGECQSCAEEAAKKEARNV